MRLFTILIVSLGLVGGCVGVREGTRGVLGISTKVLEDTKPQAAIKSFAFALDACSAAVEEELAAAGAYVYARDPEKHLTAVYGSPADTTPVGIFLEPVDGETTKVLVSSPSSPARDFLSGKLFSALDAKLLEGKNVKVKLDGGTSQGN